MRDIAKNSKGSIVPLAWLDQAVRWVAAGMSPRELWAMLRGDQPTEQPNPRYRAHLLSMLLHLRPRTYPAGATWFTHTFRLGFLTVLLFVIELITGIALMIYYVPSSEGAYVSILRIMSAVPFGEYVRDIHRLAAEAMLVTCILHLARTFWTGSYKKERAFTWITGVLLLILTLGLTFSGYLLPWDQLAYWAVTIGTSMVRAVPVIGEQLNLLLRGALEIGADELLRFYLLHVLLLPLLVILVLSVHYYRVARIHGISLPAWIEEESNVPAEIIERATRKVDFLPGLLGQEVLWTVGVLFVLFAAVFFFYDAPLESHANPLRTPLESHAPWFFLWVQGLLKLGDETVWGILVPSVLLVLLFLVPYLDQGEKRMARSRWVILGAGVLVACALFVLSYMGTPYYGLSLQPAVHIGQVLLPEEGVGPVRAVPFEQLAVGYYELGSSDLHASPPELNRVLSQYERLVTSAVLNGDLPEGRASMTIQDRQWGLRQVTLRIQWTEANGERRTYERRAYINQGRTGALPSQMESEIETGTESSSGVEHALPTETGD